MARFFVARTLPVETKRFYAVNPALYRANESRKNNSNTIQNNACSAENGSASRG